MEWQDIAFFAGTMVFLLVWLFILPRMGLG
jgi:hypothetical protein